MKKKYEILEHKADLKIRVFGKTKKELFLNALLAMVDSLKAKNQNSKIKTRNSFQVKKIKIKSIDLPTLLVDFLSEILFLIQTKKKIYNKLKFIKLTDNELEAKLFGQEIERIDQDIKAVTYHQLDAYQEKDGTWQAIVLFDI